MAELERARYDAKKMMWIMVMVMMTTMVDDNYWKMKMQIEIEVKDAET